MMLALLAVAFAALVGCGHGPQWKAPTFAEGVDTGRTYTGDCVKDHFGQYHECLAMQYGGAGEDGSE